ncbi:MAG: hypothetical protein EHM42_09985, partial [Planctomycetaceae bacterium]
MSISSPVLPGSSELSAELVSRLTERLQFTRQRIVRTRWLTGSCCLGLVAILAVASLALIDYFAELPFGVRTLGLTGLAAVVSAGLFWLFHRFISGVTLSKTAAVTEQQIAQFGQRLRTTLDYEQRRPVPAQASPQLLSAMHRQTARVA